MHVRCFNSTTPLSFELPVVWSTKIMFYEDSCAILISFKILAVFNTTSTDFVLMSADVVLKNYHNFERNEVRATVFLK